jgi:GNAT superfamily N-acetyltransferase
MVSRGAAVRGPRSGAPRGARVVSREYNSRTVTANYRVRTATLDDVDTLVRHRVEMFTDMGVPLDVPSLDAAFRTWLAAMMPAGTYRAWCVETGAGDIAAGGGIVTLPWPPGPRYMGDRLAFVYNVYTEPAHRRRGVGRLLMTAIHAWCRDAGITSMALNTSSDGRALYESMGYQVTPNPMMFLAIAGYNSPA